MESIMGFFETMAGLIWSTPTFVLLLVSGILFTFWSRFTQYRALTHGVAVVRGVYDSPNDPGAINHFQALSAALSATVGLGNIGGVALAIGIGGPGALFWMWVVGFFGMALKTVEITLAMMYRNVDDPENPHGGAMWVVERVIGDKGGVWKAVAKIVGTFFCVTLIISAFTGGNMFQSWNVAELSEHYFSIPKVGAGILLAVLVGMVILGGIRRIGQVAAKLVPFMCILYLLSALAVVLSNIVDVPGLLWLVVTSAWSSAESTGAFLGGSMGFAFTVGMQRALFSNEAGQGSAPIAHAAAKTDEPAREGIVGGIGPFIDTLCICTLTGLVIISTGTWNRDAIGDFNGPVQLVSEASDEAPTWKVLASEDVANLPASKFGEWKTGTKLFLVAEVEGATQKSNASSVVRVEGEVVAESDAERGSEAEERPRIEWQPLKLEPDKWSGTPTAVSLVNSGVHRDYGGAKLTAHAFDRQFEGLGRWLVTLAAWLFAISTMISWSYYGEQGMIYMLGQKSVIPYKLVYLALIVVATFIESTGDMVTLIDIGTGSMLIANIPIVLVLGFLAIRCLKDYDRRLHNNEFKRHDAKKVTDLVDE